VKPWHVFVAGFAGMLCGGIVVWLLVRSEMHNATTTSARLGSAEAEIESLRRVNGTIVSGITSLSRSYVNLPTFGEPRWRCNGSACWRSRKCDELTGRECGEQRIAWCPTGKLTVETDIFSGCYATHDKCDASERRTGIDRLCVGVE
jgi:hypothetical protein